MSTRDETDWKKKAQELRDRADRLHRSVLEKDVLQRSLPLRAGTIAARARLSGNEERERRFAQGARAYADAVDVDAAVLAGDIRRVVVDGLHWSVPLVRPDDAARVERAIGHQDFPYRVIAQTRELAIGGAMLDLGANVGRMCVPRVVLGDATVAYCAEPDPLNYECLMRNVRDNGLRGLVLPDRVAVGARSGTARFARTRTAGGHRVIGDAVETRHETVEVQMATLDEWTTRVGVDPDQVTFVKVDVQGSEVGVLTGAARVLSRRHISWQIEVDPPLLHAAGASAGDLFGLVERHFTHFIDLHRDATGGRVRTVSDLTEALAYVLNDRSMRTDILVFNLAGAGLAAMRR
jgi:FkbM family methyltransferase